MELTRNILSIFVICLILPYIAKADTPVYKANEAIVVGPGNTSCAVAMTPEFSKRSFDYILGIWTGMNIASNKPVGHTTDEHGILREVAEACLAYPDLPLAHAVLGVHMRFEKQNR